MPRVIYRRIVSGKEQEEEADPTTEGGLSEVLIISSSTRASTIPTPWIASSFFELEARIAESSRRFGCRPMDFVVGKQENYSVM
jgi:hypothetical protein